MLNSRMLIGTICFLAIAILAYAPATALADNNMTIVTPFLTAGSYGHSPGQIDTPVSMHIDADDNIYILQHDYSDKVHFKSVINVYDKDLSFVRSFYVLKKGSGDSGWESAPGGYYYDSLASSFVVGDNGLIYILCGWDVIVMDTKGTYVNQFPVQSYMAWIDKVGSDTKFYYPHGITLTNDGYVAITSGDTPSRHEIILIYPDGRLFRKIATSYNMNDIIRDTKGNIYIPESGDSVLHIYDPMLVKERIIALDFNGTYSGSPAEVAILPGGNITASANGIFVYDNDGVRLAHFVDNNMTWNNMSWGRPIASNSTAWLIVTSGMADADRTPQPIILYQYDVEDSRFITPSSAIDLGFTANTALWIGVLIVLVFVWLAGALFLFRNRF